MPISPSNTVIDVLGGAPGWSRSISADMTSGPSGGLDSVETQICSNCDSGHFISGSNSSGIGQWIYSGGTWDISGNATILSFDYAADLAGAIVSFIFSDGANSDTFSSGSLASTGSSNIITNSQYETIAWNQVGSLVDYTQINSVIIQVNGSSVPDLDFSIDDTMAHIPEPATFSLMGLGLAGLGWKKRRTAA